MTHSAPERLNRYLARRGVASRRGADALIVAGRVRVNGASAALGVRVDPEADRISVDGRPVATGARSASFLLNKPYGVVSTVSDPGDRPTVMGLVPDVAGLVPVGRLDRDTTGLLLLTTDGELAHRVAHPRYGIHKRYRVTARKPVSVGHVEALVRGAMLDDGPARAVAAARASARTVDLTMGDGRKREVRRLCEAAGIEVLSLTRTAVGPLRLGRLRPGEHRALTSRELAALYAAVGLPRAAS